MHRIEATVVGVEKIDETRVFEQARHFNALLETEARGIGLVDQEAHADDKFIADPAAYLLVHHEPEATTVFDRTAELVIALVRHRRQELADQVTADHGFDSIQPALLRAHRRGTEGLDDALDVMPVHFTREGAVQGLAYRGWPERGQPVLRIGLRTPAEVRKLHHDGRTGRVNPLREHLETGYDAVTGHVELAAGPGRIAVDEGRTAEHRQCKPAASLGLVVCLVCFTGHRVVVLEPTGMTGRHDPVTQGQVLEPQWLQQRVAGLVGDIAVPRLIPEFL